MAARDRAPMLGEGLQEAAEVIVGGLGDIGAGGEDTEHLDDGPGYYVCSTCGRSFNLLEELRTHQSEHEIASMLMSMQQFDEGQDVGLEEIVEPRASGSSLTKRRRSKKERYETENDFSDEIFEHAVEPLHSEKMSAKKRKHEKEAKKKDKKKSKKETGTAAAPMKGGNCVYCGLEVRKPWELVIHMVENHGVKINNLNCGDEMPLEPELNCMFCGEVFPTVHDMFYHLLCHHAKRIFGKEAVTDFCAIEMQTHDGKKLTLKVRIRQKSRMAGAQMPMFPPPMLPKSLPKRSPRKPKAPKLATIAPLSTTYGAGFDSFTPVPMSTSLYGIRNQQSQPMLDELTYGGDMPSEFDPMLANPVIYNPNPLVKPRPRKMKNQPPPDPLLQRKRQSDMGIDKIDDLPEHIVDEAATKLKVHPRGFQCTYCHKVKEDKDSGIAHVYMLHMTGERPYPCPHCAKSYDNEHNLAIHIRGAHSGKRYVCPNCSMQYKYPGDLAGHLKRNVCQKYMNVRWFPCYKCGQYFPGVLAQRAHERRCGGGVGAPKAAGMETASLTTTVLAAAGSGLDLPMGSTLLGSSIPPQIGTLN